MGQQTSYLIQQNIIVFNNITTSPQRKVMYLLINHYDSSIQLNDVYKNAPTVCKSAYVVKETLAAASKTTPAIPSLTVLLRTTAILFNAQAVLLSTEANLSRSLMVLLPA
ncbi:MAG: hypothetical protein MI866_01675 [Bacteroidales bacterium]|nr:hypothetical protein [Bacteroidales bacterium]